MTIARLTTALLLAALLSCTSVLTADAFGFSDVPTDHEHFEAVEWAAWHGIAEGYPDGTFRPERPVTRAQAASMIQRYHLSHHDGDEDERENWKFEEGR